MELKKALEIRKAKYIKRIGSPGRYKYVYKITHPGEGKEFGEAAAKVKKRIKEKKGEGKVKNAPKFTGNWNKDDQLKRYMKENKGKMVMGKHRVGDRIIVAGDPGVGMADYSGDIVAKIDENTVMVYDIEENDFEEVEKNRISSKYR